MSSLPCPLPQQTRSSVVPFELASGQPQGGQGEWDPTLQPSCPGSSVWGWAHVAPLLTQQVLPLWGPAVCLIRSRSLRLVQICLWTLVLVQCQPWVWALSALALEGL